MKTKKITFSALLIAIGVMAGSVIYIPVGVSKCFPVQHTINVIAAIILGPSYGVAIAFCISLLRNILGTGSILAFPGSMIGAFVAGIIYKKTNSYLAAAGGEIFGTGILGALAAFPIAKFVMGKKVAAMFFVAPFLTSTVGGSIIAYCILKVLDVSKIKSLRNEA
ncbi:energy coupling factor transporter S component ThiW [Clostridium omnivorum]|uniref:Energy coupling factor transporter S component ThiW n=1 Tax=Clostridium omnivorum TaxID=1604902 RepID=A0ABQ5N145_9CLOT|nr:energy coupling factor transporter S component ThiW [Clostridium sp. E14]GLC28912.1 energy coupling factor transporter S component ThiW [Clostridium sp. E14]